MMDAYIKIEKFVRIHRKSSSLLHFVMQWIFKSTHALKMFLTLVSASGRHKDLGYVCLCVCVCGWVGVQPTIGCSKHPDPYLIIVYS